MTIPSFLPPVPLWRLFLRLRGWAVLLLFLLSFICTLAARSELILAGRFDTEGILTQATVEDRYHRTVKGPDGRENTTYYLVLTYKTLEDKYHRVTVTVPEPDYRHNREGYFIELRYLDSEPTRVELKRGENRRARWLLQGLGLAFGVVGLVLFWRAGRRAVAAGRARKWGAREPAVVTGLEKVRPGGRRYRLHWRERSGREGQSLPGRFAHFSGTTVGRPVTVYQGIDRAWWSGDIGDRTDD